MLGTTVEDGDGQAGIGGDDRHLRGRRQHVQQQRGGVAQLQLGVLALGDVEVDAGHAQRPAASVVLHPGGRAQVALLTVGADDAVFGVELVRARRRQLQVVHDAVPVVGVQALAPGSVALICDIGAWASARLAVQRKHPVVPAHPPVDHIPIPDADAGGLGSQCKAVVGLLQISLDLLARRDVARDAKGANDPAGGVAQRHLGGHVPGRRPVGPVLLLLQIHRRRIGDHDRALDRCGGLGMLGGEVVSIRLAHRLRRVTQAIAAGQAQADPQEAAGLVFEIDLVGHRGHQRVHQMPLLGQGLLGQLDGGDVVDHRVQTLHLAVDDIGQQLHQRMAQRRDARSWVGPPQHALIGLRLARHRRFDVGPAGFVLIAEHLLNGLATHLLRVHTEPGLEGAVGKAVAQRRIPVGDQRRHRVQHVVQVALRRLQLGGALLDKLLQRDVERLHLPLGLAAHSDVADGLGQADHLAIGRDDRRRRDRHIDQPAVLGTAHGVVRGDGLALGDPEAELPVLVEAVWRHQQLEPRAADHLRRRIAKQPFGPGVPFDDGAVQACADDGIGGRIDNCRAARHFGLQLQPAPAALRLSVDDGRQQRSDGHALAAHQQRVERLEPTHEARSGAHLGLPGATEQWPSDLACQAGGGRAIAARCGKKRRGCRPFGAVAQAERELVVARRDVGQDLVNVEQGERPTETRSLPCLGCAGVCMGPVNRQHQQKRTGKPGRFGGVQ